MAVTDWGHILFFAQLRFELSIYDTEVPLSCTHVAAVRVDHILLLSNFISRTSSSEELGTAISGSSREGDAILTARIVRDDLYERKYSRSSLPTQLYHARIHQK